MEERSFPTAQKALNGSSANSGALGRKASSEPSVTDTGAVVKKNTTDGLQKVEVGKTLRIFDNEKADSFLDGFGYLAERPENYRFGDIVTDIREVVKKLLPRAGDAKRAAAAGAMLQARVILLAKAPKRDGQRLPAGKTVKSNFLEQA